MLTKLNSGAGSSVEFWCSVSMVHPKSSMWLGFNLSLAALPNCVVGISIEYYLRHCSFLHIINELLSLV